MRLVAALLVLSTAAAARAEEPFRRSLRATAELGFLAVASHKIQYGREGTYFDYAARGAQDVLFPVSRLSLDLRLSRRHQVTLLYQPLSLVTTKTLAGDLRLDDTTFAAGTPMRFRYDFPFWRASWLYDFASDPANEYAIGVSLQLRNATIDFESLDGKTLFTNRDVGPVPVLKARVRHALGRGFWVGGEIDGFYAPVSYINGSDTEVVGAIADASVRAGYDLADGAGMFLNVRYLGGGAVGASPGDDRTGDGYVRNWLHFLTVSVGGTYDLLGG